VKPAQSLILAFTDGEVQATAAGAKPGGGRRSAPPAQESLL
jgi:hypothetical protein